MSKKKILISLSIIALLGTGVLFALYNWQKPLMIDGFTEYNKLKKQVDIELINKGSHDIFVQEVLVNNKIPKKVQLVISYSGHLAAGGIDDDPLAEFININEAPVHPQLSPEEFQAAVKTKTTPINYGIRIMNEEDIGVVKIKYRYWWFTFMKEVNLNTWPE